MTSLLLAIAVCGQTESYNSAYTTAAKENKPLVVMVGAKWCPACQQMDKYVIPIARQRGLFQKVVYAHVDVDVDREDGQKLAAGGSLPQFIVYQKRPEGWFSNKLIGYRTIEEIETFMTGMIVDIPKLPINIPDWLALSPAVTLVEFTDGNGASDKIKPDVDRLLQHGYPIVIVRTDSGRGQQMMSAYKLQGSPYFVLFVDGHPIQQIVGTTNYDQLESWLKNALLARYGGDKPADSKVE